MARPLRIEYPGAFYHVTSRGNEHSGATLKEIGERFGPSDAAVSQTSRRLLLKAGTDEQIRHKLERVDALLKDVSS